MNLLQAFSNEQFKELEGIKRKTLGGKNVPIDYDPQLFGIFKGLI